MGAKSSEGIEKNCVNDMFHNLTLHPVSALKMHTYERTVAFSYFNTYELETVVQYVDSLLKGGPSREPVEQKDIGIIAPYIRQMYKLKARLKEKGREDIEVGTTETFQGREKRVILISTVRSNRNLLDYDSKFGLGFVADAKVCYFKIVVVLKYRLKCIGTVLAHPNSSSSRRSNSVVCSESYSDRIFGYCSNKTSLLTHNFILVYM